MDPEMRQLRAPLVGGGVSYHTQWVQFPGEDVQHLGALFTLQTACERSYTPEETLRHTPPSTEGTVSVIGLTNICTLCRAWMEKDRVAQDEEAQGVISKP